MGIFIKKDIGVCRAVRATLICAAILVAIIASILAPGITCASAEKEGTRADRMWKALCDGKSFEGSMEEAGMTMLKEDAIPSWMEDELLDREWLSGGFSANGHRVVWISKRGELDDFREGLEGELKAKGWIEADMQAGAEEISTFTKSKGECRWLIAEYVQSGEEAAAVLRIERK